MRIGYARVSNPDQRLALQRDALGAAGCERLFEDKASGAAARLPARQELLDYARPGDVVVVWRLDRLGRSLRDLVEVVTGLAERAVGLHSLHEAIDAPRPTVHGPRTTDQACALQRCGIARSRPNSLESLWRRPYPSGMRGGPPSRLRVLVLGLVTAAVVAGCRTPDPGAAGVLRLGDSDAAGPADAGPGTWRASAANNRDFLATALALIGQARRRVHVIEYVIYRQGAVQEVLDALAAAAGRGVEVMVLADETSDSTEAALEWLRQRGVEAKLDSPRTVTHNKLIIADDKVLVGSTNFTDNAIERNNEASVLVEGADAAAFYERYYRTLWLDSDSDPDVSWIGRGGLVPLANRDTAGAYLACIEGAGSEIDVVLYAMRYDEAYPGSSYNRLVEALVEAHGSGRRVRVVLDASGWITERHINDRAREVLVAAGIEVRHPPASTVTHAKVVTCDETVIVSDANWAHGALDRYNGTGVQVTGGDIAGQYESYFRRIWETAR